MRGIAYTFFSRQKVLGKEDCAVRTFFADANVNGSAVKRLLRHKENTFFRHFTIWTQTAKIAIFSKLNLSNQCFRELQLNAESCPFDTMSWLIKRLIIFANRR